MRLAVQFQVARANQRHHDCTFLHVSARSKILCCREFKLSEDMYAQDSIELLKNSGIDFACNEQRGINVHRFGELLMSSGIVLSDEVRAVPQHFLRSIYFSPDECCGT